MTYANVEKLAEIAANDSAIAARFAAARTPAQFAETAVAVASEQGLPFGQEDASAWIAQNVAMRENDELSDMQLKEVAGGKQSLTATRKADHRENALAKLDALSAIMADPEAAQKALGEAIGQAFITPPKR